MYSILLLEFLGMPWNLYCGDPLRSVLEALGSLVQIKGIAEWNNEDQTARINTNNTSCCLRGLHII